MNTVKKTYDTAVVELGRRPHSSNYTHESVPHAHGRAHTDALDGSYLLTYFMGPRVTLELFFSPALSERLSVQSNKSPLECRRPDGPR